MKMLYPCHCFVIVSRTACCTWETKVPSKFFEVVEGFYFSLKDDCYLWERMLNLVMS